MISIPAFHFTTGQNENTFLSLFGRLLYHFAGMRMDVSTDVIVFFLLSFCLVLPMHLQFPVMSILVLADIGFVDPC